MKPIACELGVLAPSERQRYEALRRDLQSARRQTRELPDGYAVVFPAVPEVLLKLAEWITFERRCCPFLTFGLELATESENIELKLSGREGVKQFLREALTSARNT